MLSIAFSVSLVGVRWRFICSSSHDLTPYPRLPDVFPLPMFHSGTYHYTLPVGSYFQGSVTYLPRVVYPVRADERVKLVSIALDGSPCALGMLFVVTKLVQCTTLSGMQLLTPLSSPVIFHLGRLVLIWLSRACRCFPSVGG